jgi:rhodanese-related sulfurtransferase
MSLLNRVKQQNINQGIKSFHSTPGALLLDVRSKEEFDQEHIPGSKNLPLPQLDKISTFIDNENIPVFVYCHSGVRSRQASVLLSYMGYTNVNDIGGIADYTGRMEN